MPNYVTKALKQFQHIATKRQICTVLERSHSIWCQEAVCNTGIKSAIIRHQDQTIHPQVCGKFLFLGRAVDSTLLCPISAIASQSSKPTQDALQQTLQLLNYLATQEDAVLSYHVSDMITSVHSNASYLSKPKARRRAGGYFFPSSNTTIPPNNGAILNIAHMIKNSMPSATEAELAGLYIMAHEAVYIRIILKELGHKQPPMPLQTDNAMADAVINGKVQPKHTKAISMRFHWLRDCECQQQLRLYWQPGKLNYADYWTKHHPESHHCNMCKKSSCHTLFLKSYKQNNNNNNKIQKQLAQHYVTLSRPLGKGVMILA